MAKKKKRAVKLPALSARDFRQNRPVPEMLRELVRLVEPLPELARAMRIPLSTLREYRAGKRAPTPQHLLTIQTNFAVAYHDELRRTQTHQVNAVAPQKNVTRVDPNDPRKKRHIPSDTFERHVGRSDPSAIVRAVKNLARRARQLDAHLSGVQFLVLTETESHDYPDQFLWSGWEPLARMDDDEAEQYVDDIFQLGLPIFLRYHF